MAAEVVLAEIADVRVEGGTARLAATEEEVPFSLQAVGATVARIEAPLLPSRLVRPASLDAHTSWSQLALPP